MSDDLVVGIDAGGTSTRCVIATTAGTIVARGAAGGANQRSAATRPADSLHAALSQALAGLDRQRVRFGVAGVAGAGAAGRRAAQWATEMAWRSAGLSASVVTLTDLEVAFAAGTAAPSGLLLLSGTGAVAAACRDGRVTHRCDGYGWLLGDEGSAVWIGREGLRAVLAALDGRAADTALTGTVTGMLTGAPPPTTGTPDAHAQALIAAAYAMPPAALGRLAPLVSAAATAGDPVAEQITRSAVGRLFHALLTVHRLGTPAPTDPTPGPTGPTPNPTDPTPNPADPTPSPAPAVVLAGSVLLTPGPVADGVRAGVCERFGAPPREAHDGAAGAAAIAIGRLSGRAVPADVHARLVGPPSDPAASAAARAR